MDVFLLIFVISGVNALHLHCVSGQSDIFLQTFAYLIISSALVAFS